MRSYLRTYALVFCLLLVGGTANADAQVDVQQRKAFKAALQALRQGDLAAFERHSASVQDYALYPYLRYAFLRDRLEIVEPRRIKLFLARYKDTPLAGRLRYFWLRSLARREHWLQYLAAYRGSSNDRLRCHYANAKLQTGRTEGLWESVRELWRVGHSQPDACDPVFAAWRESGRMSEQDVLDRIALAMDERKLGLVRYLARFLPPNERRWIRKWRQVHARPAQELARLEPEPERPEWSARLFAYGVAQLARRDVEQADRLWQKRRAAFELSRDTVRQTERTIALNLAFARHPSAAERLGGLAPEALDDYTRHWRIRAALWHQDWNEVLAALDALPDQGRGDERWLYWRARALEALGGKGYPRGLFAVAAQCRCYYGFLAAERVGLPPAIDTAPLEVERPALTAMAAMPSMVRARELHALGRDTDARREWWAATRNLDQPALRTAAKLADSWGWHDRAILTLGRTDSLDDLELRFPMPYAEQVSEAAAKRELDTAFVYSVMRQESAFNARARSHAGALGLMQLMPATARHAARHISRPLPAAEDLLTAEHNIQLGTAHLRQLMDAYDGNLLYTMAAYNAGPGRVTRWKPKGRAMPADVWVETMPFRETRKYVQRILAYIRIYQWRLGRDLTPMSHHLRTLGAPAADAVADSSSEDGQPAG